MSGGAIESLSWALHVEGLTPAQRLVLVGICNHDGDGGAWPSLDTLAGYACCSTRHVRRTIRELEDLGLVTRVLNAGGHMRTPADRRPNLYVIHRPGRRADTHVRPVSSRADTHVRHGRTPMSAELPYNYPVDNSPTGTTEPCFHRWISASTGECATCGVLV